MDRFTPYSQYEKKMNESNEATNEGVTNTEYDDEPIMKYEAYKLQTLADLGYTLGEVFGLVTFSQKTLNVYSTTGNVKKRASFSYLMMSGSKLTWITKTKKTMKMSTEFRKNLVLLTVTNYTIWNGRITKVIIRSSLIKTSILGG